MKSKFQNYAKNKSSTHSKYISIYKNCLLTPCVFCSFRYGFHTTMRHTIASAKCPLCDVYG